MGWLHFLTGLFEQPVQERAPVIVWHVWSDGRRDRFFGSQREAECFIHRHYGEVHLHPDEHWHAWTRENYGTRWHHPDGHQLWIGWTRQAAVHLERHEIDPTAHGVARSLNHLPKR